jgi:hypothetical protein
MSQKRGAVAAEFGDPLSHGPIGSPSAVLP